MGKHIAENVKAVFVVLLWALSLFSQHIICFDFFDSNFLYLYVLAILCALTQYIILHYSCNIRSGKCILKICCVVYICAVVLKALAQICFFRFQLYTRGLDILCLAIDGIGALYTFLELKKHNI